MKSALSDNADISPCSKSGQARGHCPYTNVSNILTPIGYNKPIATQLHPHEHLMNLFFFSGPPGGGKTTFATHLAQYYKIPLFSRDHIQSFLYQRNLINGSTLDGYYWLLSQAEFQLNLGVSCILDAVFPKHEFRQTAAQIADKYGATFYPIHCYCSDQTLWKSRWHQRASADDGAHWMEFKWADVERIAAYFEAWDHPNLIQIDSAQDHADNINALLSMIEQY